MNTTKFIFGSVEYQATINMNVILKFSRKNGLKTVSEFAKCFDGMENDQTFEQVENIAMLLYLGVREANRLTGSGAELEVDDCLVLIGENPQLVGDLLSKLSGPQTKSEPETENPQKPSQEEANSISMK
jgi:hypothetical protein